MSTPSRRADFFALEANEYLAELEPLAAVPDRPDAERLVRGARALRGAALMAGLGTYARAAAGLEAVARQVRDHALGWEPNAREVWVEGLSTLRSLVSRAATWEAADDRQSLQLAERIEQVLSGRPARAATPPTPALTPGVRAFIARESALIAGSLEQASRALAPVPPHAALAGVLERMQSLRGLGASAELSPLPELLDAMEIATRTLLADVPPPPNVAAVFADAAHAMSAMARSVADAGRVAVPPELASIARRLLDSYASETDVVPIASLAPDGVDSVLHMGTPPAALPDTDPVPVELVSVGDHLLLVAEGLTRPTVAAARDLKLFVLHRTVAAMPTRSATGRFLAPLTEAIASAIASQLASERPDAFLAMLRGCGRFLVEASATTDRAALTRRRDAVATSLRMIGRGGPSTAMDKENVAEIPAPSAPEAPPQATPMPNPVAAVAAPAIVPEEMPAPLIPRPGDVSFIQVLASSATPPIDVIVDIASLAPDEPIVSIESLAPDEPIVAIEDLAFDPPAPQAPVIPAEAPGTPSRLETAFAARRMALLTNSESEATLAGLIRAEIVPIDALLYRGAAALDRAALVREELRRALQHATTLDAVREQLDELLDLVPLARDAA